MSLRSPARPSLARYLNMLLALAFAAAIVGFIIGTRPSPRPRPPVDHPVEPMLESTIPSQTYAALRRRQFGPAATVTSDLDYFRPPSPSANGLTPPVEAVRLAAITQRAERRVYDGAPPTVPHPIDEQNAAVCIACHKTGLAVRDRLASAMPHEPLSQCTQCHVPANRSTTAPQTELVNAFNGLRITDPGPRVWPGAPPQIPHATAMRENCISCHGPFGIAGLRTSHPERTQCLQCHAATAAGPSR